MDHAVASFAVQNLRNACSGIMTSTLSGHNQHIQSCDATSARAQIYSMIKQIVQALRLGTIIASHVVV